MGIETSTTGAPHPLEKSASVARKQSGGSEDSSASGAPTFRSVLTAMEPDAGSPEPTATAAPALGTQDATATVVLPPDASALLARNPNRAVLLEQPDGALLAGQGGLAGALVPMAVGPGLVHQADTLAGGRTDGKPGKSAGKTELPGVAGKSAGVAAASDLAAHAVGAPSAAMQHATNMQAMLRRSDVDRAALEAGTQSLAQGAQAQASESRTAADGAHSDWRAALVAHTENAQAPGASMLDALGAFSRAAANTRGAERPTGRPLFVPAGSALTGSWAEPALSGGSPAALTTYAPDAAIPVPETAVAEKLNFWISRGVQNAELQLDAFGGGSVKVSISLQGNEAQVEFRSDQPEARKLLQDALPQLSDMLKGEGLLLSGGFVGTSAQQDPGARERAGKALGVRSSVVGVEAPVAAATAGLSRTPGRAVDLFV